MRSDAVQARSWLVCVLLFLATTLNYLDRQTMSILAPMIQAEMHLDNAALGWLFSVFYYSYTVAQFGIGLLLDRAHLRWALALAVLAWCAVAGLTGLAGTFATLLAFRLALGVAESANWPAAMRIVARVLPPRDRSLGNGIFTSGTSVGALIAPTLILGLASMAGWRWAFASVASLGIVWLLIWVWFTRDRSLAPVWIQPGGSIPVKGVYSEVLRSSRFWRVFPITILVNPCLYFNVNWLPTYLVQVREFRPGRELGVALTLIYLGLDLGYLACGVAVRLLCKGHSLRKARQTVFLGATTLLAICAFVPWLRGRELVLGALLTINFAIGVWISMYLTMAQEVSSKNVSTAAGLLGGSGSLAGAVAMWAVGRITRNAAGFSVPLVAVAAAGILAALAALSVSPECEDQGHPKNRQT